MSYSAEQLYTLLPAIFRQRDAKQGYPLRGFVEIIAGQAAILEQDIDRLYENWFIETCDEWVVPYIGDLLGVRGAYPIKFSRRAEVANTISYRRRKGTASVLEQLARDATGWNARVVEFFELLATTQHINHVRLHSQSTADLCQGNLLEHVDGPFDSIARTAEVRPIKTDHLQGRYNIPNIGIFLWRLGAYPLTQITPHQVDNTGLHYTFSVLGHDTPLFNSPVSETSASHIAEEVNVPAPIRRRALFDIPGAYYGSNLSIEISIKKEDEYSIYNNIIACDLSDWIHHPPAKTIALDPKLGRFAFAPGEAPTSGMKVSYHYGFSADFGGGEYERAASFTEISGESYFSVGDGKDYTTINAALAQWLLEGRPSAVIEIKDSGTYNETIAIEMPKNIRLEIRAANETRPALLLTGEMLIGGEVNSAFEINGLLIANYLVRVSGEIERLRVQHCTLVPGKNLNSDGSPTEPATPSLFIEAADAEVQINHCIVGAIRTAPEVEVQISDSIIDSNDNNSTYAYAAVDGTSAGGPLQVSRCTVIGKIRTQEMSLGENSIFLGMVVAERRQQGCVRFCYLTPGSLVPKRYRCQPTYPADSTPSQRALIATQVSPQFTSLHYGDSGYCQLTPKCPREIRRGSEDESEMGAFSSLQQPQREDNLIFRLEEYLRFGLEAGIFYVT